MSIDTTFKPLGPTVNVLLVGVQAVNAPGNNASGITSFRVHNNAVAKAIFAWGSNAAAALLNASGIYPSTSFTMEIGEVTYLDLPYNTFFCGGTGASFEVTPGMGGTR